jgi:hypothetical protein
MTIVVRRIKRKDGPYERVIVQVMVNWSWFCRVTAVKVFSAIIVPPEVAVKRPAFTMLLCVAVAVNVLVTVYVL